MLTTNFMCSALCISCVLPSVFHVFCPLYLCLVYLRFCFFECSFSFWAPWVKFLPWFKQIELYHNSLWPQIDQRGAWNPKCTGGNYQSPVEHSKSCRVWTVLRMETGRYSSFTSERNSIISSKWSNVEYSKSHGVWTVLRIETGGYSGFTSGRNSIIGSKWSNVEYSKCHVVWTVLRMETGR